MKSAAPFPLHSIIAATTLAFAGCNKAPEADAKQTGAKDAGAAAAPAATVKDGGTMEGATALLKKFLVPGADIATMSKALRPTTADYAKVFTADFAKKLEEMQKPLWEASPAAIAPKEGQTELKLSKATTDDFKNATDAAKEFPGGYSKMGDKLLPGVTLFRFKFVKPGETLGMAFDGLTFVNGQWRIFPKPWRAAE